MRLRDGVGSLLLFAFGVSACATAYTPRPGPRVQVIMQGGAPAYVREGKVYESGLFGGELLEAVQGNPAAESHAKAFAHGQVAGFLTMLAGVASAAGGTGLVLANSSRLNDERSSSEQAIGATLLFGGAVAYVVGLVLILNAQPHQWDAINIYNDGLPDFPRGPLSFPYPAAPGALPPASLAPPVAPPPPPSAMPSVSPPGPVPSPAPASPR